MLLFVGTTAGPERELARADGIPFVGIQAGKLRRYWDPQNVSDVGRVGIGLLQALRISSLMARNRAAGTLRVLASSAASRVAPRQSARRSQT